ncbi:hypothetical protein A1QO_02495 [Vibrio genomosp. F10 str. ZF-129]|uniref:Uncharacterized protein n=1 Tax=Vibrio genomosp. F10 str. ZF-129 TaxID=1187848 RepID=A0A1E5BKB0_9VIBR|nr:hypothetical protein [Vibrio genomosp. F10]OEE38266.1 hypothetical protein A1QO_02495 [Vibrio genomosp. F10 str. ZF-129]
MFVPDLIVDGIKTAIQDAQQFDTKDEAISEAKSVIKRYLEKKIPAKESVKAKSDYSETNEVAAASLMVKMEAIRDSIDTMTEDEYGDWVNSLEFDEFIEFIRLGEK